MSKLFHCNCLIVAVITSFIGIPSKANAQSADERLQAFFQSHLEEVFQMRPFDATLLGDHRYDHLLDDISSTARQGWLEHNRRQLEKLNREFASASLSANGKIDFQIFRDDLVRNIWLAENTKPFEDDPRTYGNYINDSVYSLLVQSTLPREKNIENAIARMKQIPRIVAVARQTLRTPPKPILETAILQNKGAISFYEKGIFDLAGDTPQLPALKAAAASVVEELKAYQTFLEKDVLPNATSHWRLGKEKFARKLELVLDIDWDADRVLAEAESEFSRVQRDMYVVSRQLWHRYFPDKPLPPDDEPGVAARSRW